MLLTMGTMALPSVKASTLTSGPVRNSSTTIWLPAAPKARSSMMVRTPSRAAARSLQISTPLPSARPSAFSTMGQRVFASRYARAAPGSAKTS